MTASWDLPAMGLWLGLPGDGATSLGEQRSPAFAVCSTLCYALTDAFREPPHDGFSEIVTNSLVVPGTGWMLRKQSLRVQLGVGHPGTWVHSLGFLVSAADCKVNVGQSMPEARSTRLYRRFAVLGEAGTLFIHLRLSKGGPLPWQ